MKIPEKMAIRKKIAEELNKLYGTEEVRTFLAHFSIPLPPRKNYASKFSHIMESIKNITPLKLKKIANELDIDTDVFIIQPVKSKSPPAKPREPFRPVSDFATAPAVKPTTSLPIKSNNNSLIVKAFISHSTKNKKIAMDIRAVLKKYGIIAFVSGKDIKGGQPWQKTIRKEIDNMDIFIAIHTQAFSKSLWCQQETGMALVREEEVEIIPINVGMRKAPESFLTNFQYIKSRAKNAEEVVKEIFETLKDSPKTKELYFAKIADKVKEAVKKESGQLDKKLKPYQYANLNNPSGVFLSIFIEVEVLLRNTHSLYFGDRDRHAGNPQSIVKDLLTKGVFSRELVNDFKIAIRLRNKIVHGVKIPNEPYEIELFSKTLLLLKENLTNVIRNHEKRQLGDPLPGKARQLGDRL